MTFKKDYKLAVLSIDGGGIKGIIPAMILTEIEERTLKPIHELFDLIAGTSTGGILSLGLVKPNEDRSGAKFSAKELVDLYTKEGKLIFTKNYEQKITQFIPENILEIIKTLFNRLDIKINLEELFSSKYTRREKVKVIKQWLGENTPLSEALIEVVITSYAVNTRKPFFFTSNSDRDNPQPNNFHQFCSGCTMYDAAIATSAAPTFFKAYHHKFSRVNRGEYMLVDGGVIANNPTSIAIIEAMKSYENKTGNKIDLKDILVVSLGTGTATRRFSDKVNNWGLIKWAKPLLEIVFSGQSQVTDYQMEYFLSKEQYYRFQLEYNSDLRKIQNYSYMREQIDVNDDMDDVSEKNINNLTKAANQFIQEAATDLEKLRVDLLQALNTRELSKKN
jgi:patatin-like phospholipase/acyl hydrolase